jgi:hypothetical protein
MQDEFTFPFAYFALGDESADPPAVLVIDAPAGHVVPRHSHDCHRFETVARGSLHVVDDGNERTLHPRDVMISEPNHVYGPNTAGPDGCTLYEVFSSLRGAYQLTYQTADRQRFVDYSSPGAIADRPNPTGP